MEIQQRLGYTDERFALEVLNVSKGYWSKLRSGKARGDGGTFLRNLLARFPNLVFSMPSNVPVVVEREQTTAPAGVDEELDIASRRRKEAAAA